MEPFIGQLMMVGFNFAPRGWALCDGQFLQISQNTALFSLLGTTYGGDGRTTFRLPDLRGRTPVHVGAGPGLTPVQQGEPLGAETTTLNVNNLPSHTHVANVTESLAVRVSGETADQDDPDGHVFGAGPEVYATTPDSDMGTQSIGGDVNVDILNTGNNTAFNNMQPSLGIYHIIALQGIFPSRS